MNLGDFLFEAAQSRTPWNCSTMPADWCIARGHPDFAAKWRSITEAAACDAVAAGGLLPLWREGIAGAIPEVSGDLRTGDIGVIAAIWLEAGAIFDGDFWVLQGPKGIACLRLDRCSVLAAWRP